VHRHILANVLTNASDLELRDTDWTQCAVSVLSLSGSPIRSGQGKVSLHN